MAYSQASNRATQKYVKANYERIYLVCKKGQKEKYQSLAEMSEKSLNQYIIDLLEEKLQEGL